MVKATATKGCCMHYSRVAQRFCVEPIHIVEPVCRHHDLVNIPKVFGTLQIKSPHCRESKKEQPRTQRKKNLEKSKNKPKQQE